MFSFSSIFPIGTDSPPPERGMREAVSIEVLLRNFRAATDAMNNLGLVRVSGAWNVLAR